VLAERVSDPRSLGAAFAGRPRTSEAGARRPQHAKKRRGGSVQRLRTVVSWARAGGLMIEAQSHEQVRGEITRRIPMTARLLDAPRGEIRRSGVGFAEYSHALRWRTLALEWMTATTRASTMGFSSS